MRILAKIARGLAAGLVGLTLSVTVAAAGEIIGLDGQPVAKSFGFLSPTETEELMAGLMAPVAHFTQDGMPTTTTIGQVGTDHFAHSAVAGSANLSVIQQSGHNNRAVQAIVGNNTALLLNQSGENNTVLQASIGNDNFQYLDVSGNGNDVAYLQAGNELAGAMRVGGTNSAVLAVQTPSSSNYLMPVGLDGLTNQVVVIVPGRMYVFNR